MQLVSIGTGIQTEFSLAAIHAFSTKPSCQWASLGCPGFGIHCVALAFPGSCVTFRKSHQSLGLNCLSCITGMPLTACLGGMIRRLREHGAQKCLGKYCEFKIRWGHCCLFSILTAGVSGLWVGNIEHFSKEPINWGLGFGDLHNLCQPWEPAGLLSRLMEWCRSTWGWPRAWLSEGKRASAVMWTEGT